MMKKDKAQAEKYLNLSTLESYLLDQNQPGEFY
jgi:hypothetical protein